MSGTFTDSTGRTYPTTLSKSEYEAERAKADEVHVVRWQTTTFGGLVKTPDCVTVARTGTKWGFRSAIPVDGSEVEITGVPMAAVFDVIHDPFST